MGKGDKKTKRGKIIKGTFGRLRPKKRNSRLMATSAREQLVEEEKALKETRVKQPARERTKASKEKEDKKKQEKKEEKKGK